MRGLFADSKGPWGTNNDGAGSGESEPPSDDGGSHGPEPVTLPAAFPAAGFQAPFEARFGRKVAGSVDRFALLALCAAYEDRKSVV